MNLYVCIINGAEVKHRSVALTEEQIRALELAPGWDVDFCYIDEDDYDDEEDDHDDDA